MDREKVQMGYWQYYKMIWKQAWPKMWTDVGLLSVFLGIIVFGITETFVIYSQSPDPRWQSFWNNVVIPVIISLLAWGIVIIIMMFYYTSREIVFTYDAQKTAMDDFKDKYELVPIAVKFDLREYNEPLVRMEASYDYIWSTTNRNVGIRVTNDDQHELTNCWGSLNSLVRINSDGGEHDLFPEATRNGPMISWSGGADEHGEVSIKPGKDRILNIAMGENRDLIFLLQNLQYRQIQNGIYVFEVEVGGRVFGKPFESHKEFFHIRFEKLYHAFYGELRNNIVIRMSIRTSHLLCAGIKNMPMGHLEN